MDSEQENSGYKDMLLKTLKWTGIISSVAFVMGYAGLWYYLNNDSGNQFTRAYIMGILSKETSVLFSDGKTKVGAFFQDDHRDYLPFDSIPTLLSEAVISSEDKNFFNHAGIDYQALIAAQVDNLLSFSMRRGGSTISQQTVKNLYFKGSTKKWDRIKRKIPEFFKTLKMERKFSKKDILEFYLNQFYVHGNGKGVAIASRFFFDKELKDLELHELAFIAGSVKGPIAYTSFNISDPEKRKRKIRKSHLRMRYVLKRMYEDEKITQEEYEKSRKTILKFKNGTFRYNLSTNMVLVEKTLKLPAIMESLDAFGIKEYQSAGLKIYTTLNKDLQKSSSYHLYRNLSNLDIKFNGYKKHEEKRLSPSRMLRPGAFVTGEICSLIVKEEVPKAIQVAFYGKKHWVTEKKLKAFNALWYLHQSGLKSPPLQKVKKEFYEKNLKLGDKIYVSIPFQQKSEKKLVLEIAQRPEIQGGTILLKGGKVLSHVGGFGNTGYDRVTQAKRQFGSTFKPFVYSAALELGWTPLDTLLNHRQIFKLGNTFYYPRPAHKPEPMVSMIWAGRLSENIASVYLLYHLMDKLKNNDFWAVAHSMGVSPENLNGHGNFAAYVRDSLGFLLLPEDQNEIRYYKILDDVSIDLVFEGKEVESTRLKYLPYGNNFEKELETVKNLKPKKKKAKRENNLRKNLLRHNFKSYLTTAKKWRADESAVVRVWQQKEGLDYSIFNAPPSLEKWMPVLIEKETITEDILLCEGIFTLSTLFAIEKKMEEIQVTRNYNKEDLFYSPEFKALLGLRYIKRYVQSLGITSPLESVMSFPLGSNTITLEEASTAYQTMKEGYLYTSAHTNNHYMLIEKIALPNGKVIYQDSLKKLQMVYPNAKNGVQSILRSIVEGGTGARISNNLWISSKSESITLKVPAYGKTGTTNDYRNGAFIGFVAGPTGDAGLFSPEAGYTIGVYVGFDDNREMKRKGLIGYGGTVSLPSWIPIAKNLIKSEKFSSKVDFFDINLQFAEELPLEGAQSLQNFYVYKKNGLLIDKEIEDKNTYTIVSLPQ